MKWLVIAVLVAAGALLITGHAPSIGYHYPSGFRAR